VVNAPRGLRYAGCCIWTSKNLPSTRLGEQSPPRSALHAHRRPPVLLAEHVVLRRGGPVLARQRVSLPTVRTARAVTSHRDRVAFPGVRLLPNPQPVLFGPEGGPVDHHRQRRVRRRTSCPDGQSCPSPIVGSFTSLRARRAVTGLPQGVQRVCPV
jgi:hypothetical protein